MAEDRPLAIVTGASTGNGYELAECRAENGFDPGAGVDEPRIREAADELRTPGTQVEADLASLEEIDKLYQSRRGPGPAFRGPSDQCWSGIR